MIYDDDLTHEELVEKHNIRFDKIYEYLYDFFKSKNFPLAIKAMEMAHSYHKGIRKNGAPEFMHQLEICLFLMTLPQLPEDPKVLEAFYCAALLHDIREDYDVSDAVIRNNFGNITANLVELLTKEFLGIRKNEQEYFNEILNDPLASLIKLGDRYHNISTMGRAFNYNKQKSYIEEVRVFFYPLVKNCLKLYPEYNLSFYTVKSNLEVLCIAIVSSLDYVKNSKIQQELNFLKPVRIN